MRVVTQGLMQEFYENGKTMRRASWPEGDHISVDGAECTLWYYDAEEDELTAGYRLGFAELAADDWELEKVEDK